MSSQTGELGFLTHNWKKILELELGAILDEMIQIAGITARKEMSKRKSVFRC